MPQRIVNSIWWSLSTLGEVPCTQHAADGKIKVDLVVTVRKFFVNSNTADGQYDGHCEGSSL